MFFSNSDVGKAASSGRDASGFPEVYDVFVFLFLLQEPDQTMELIYDDLCFMLVSCSPLARF